MFNPFKPGVLFYGTSTNNAEPDQTPQNEVSNQVLHCFLTECVYKISLRLTTQQPFKWRWINPFLRVGNYIRHKWVSMLVLNTSHI